MGDLCGKSHVPEECDLFVGLPPEDRLVIVAKKRLCYLCFHRISALDVRVAGGVLDVVREQQLFDFASEARIIIREDDLRHALHTDV